MAEQKMTLSVLQNAIEKAALDLIKISDDGEFEWDSFQRRLKELIELSRDACEDDSIKSYRETAIRALPDMRKAAQEFEERSFERWKPAFDHLEMMWEIAQELCESNAKEFDHDTDESTQFVMAALSNILPKALLVTNEIICLLKGGFPDGALARWRSLHELNVTAMYILQEGRDSAIAYMLSFHFTARRAALQMNEHAELAGLEKFSKDELEGFETRRNEAEKLLGRKIEKDKNGEWPAINLKHRTIADIEKHVGMDHWRPRYKWASQHTHADLKPVGNLLGMSESKEAMNLVGASNSGFADPFMMTAISLSQITRTYLSVTPNLDRVVHSSVLAKFSDEMSEIVMKIQKKNECLKRRPNACGSLPVQAGFVEGFPKSRACPICVPLVDSLLRTVTSAETRQGLNARPRTRIERSAEGGRTLFNFQSPGERKTTNHQIEMLRTTHTKGSFRS